MVDVLSVESTPTTDFCAHLRDNCRLLPGCGSQIHGFICMFGIGKPIESTISNSAKACPKFVRGQHDLRRSV